MKRFSVITIIAALTAVTAVQAADLYFDVNGTTNGFGTDTGVYTTWSVDFGTNTQWNTDPTGGAAGSFVAPGSNDVINFGIEGTAQKNFNWKNYGHLVLDGVIAFHPTTNDTATINRYQKNGSIDGGFETFAWGPNAVMDASTVSGGGMQWNLGSVGDFTFIGPNRLTLEGPGPKISGTCTVLSNALVRIFQAGNVSSASHFDISDGRGFWFHQDIDNNGLTILNMGGVKAADAEFNSSGGSGNLKISPAYLDLGNGVATNEIFCGWGITINFSAGSTNVFDIAKYGGSNYADRIYVDWGDRSPTMDGVLKVNLVSNDVALAEGDTFTLFEKAIPTGAFTGFELPSLPGSLTWGTSTLGVDGTISVVSPSAGPPAAPTGLVAVATTVGNVTLTWNANTEGDLAGYKIYRSETQGAGHVEIASVGATTNYVDTTVSADEVTYYYMITAVDSEPLESAFSDEVSVASVFGLRNGGFEQPVGGGDISTSGDWQQLTNAYQRIQAAGWAAQNSAQGAWIQGQNHYVTNSFYQDRPAFPGVAYVMEANFRIEPNFLGNGSELDMSLVWLDGGMSEISRESIEDVQTLVDSTWLNGDDTLSIVGAAPGGTAFARVLFEWRTGTNLVTGGVAALVDNVSLSLGSSLDPYQVWSASWGVGIGSETDDYEGDGLLNLYEYGVGGNPTNDDAALVSPVGYAGADGWFYYVFKERDNDPSLTIEAKRKGDLVSEPTWVTTGIDYVGESAPVANIKSVTNRTDIGDAEFLIQEVTK